MQKAGKRPLVLEKTEQVGGSTALSGGVVWVPNNVYELQAGVPDTPEKAAAYLDACAGDVGPASSPARRSAFLETGRGVLDFYRAPGKMEERSVREGGVSRGRVRVAAGK